MFFGSGLGYILSFLVVLTVLVFVHELGHYLVARSNGVRVEVFSIGFGPELFGRLDRHGTRWRLSAIPFGGYVKWFGDVDGSSVLAEGLDTMTAEERAGSYHHKSVGVRAAIAAAGPAANFIFAILVLAVLYMTAGQPYTPPAAGDVVADSPAAAAGIQAGDRFKTIDGNTIDSFSDIQRLVMLNAGSPMHMVLSRGDQNVEMDVVPKVTDHVDRFGGHHHYGTLGVVRPAGSAYIKQNPAVALGQAVRDTWNMSVGTLKAIGQMITGERTTEELGGPLQIMKLSGEAAQSGALDLIGLMALISINLGLMNLFPIPVLDGGHLLFYAAEAILGRPLGRRTQEMGFRVGMALVLSLMIFSTWNDLAQSHLITFLRNLVT